jgi:hypothetical protein
MAEIRTTNTRRKWLDLVESPPTRNVWSAAVLQAKNEEDRIGLRECIRPLSE